MATNFFVNKIHSGFFLYENLKILKKKVAALLLSTTIHKDDNRVGLIISMMAALGLFYDDCSPSVFLLPRYDSFSSICSQYVPPLHQSALDSLILLQNTASNSYYVPTPMWCRHGSAKSWKAV